MKFNKWVLVLAAIAVLTLNTYAGETPPVGYNPRTPVGPSATTITPTGAVVTTQTNETVLSITNSLGIPFTFTNHETITVVNWNPLSVEVAGPDTNANSGIQAGFNEIIAAVTGHSTNWYGAAYMLYAPKIAQKVGGGFGVFYPISQYVIGGVRLEYINGGFWMPNGTVTFQVPTHPFTFIGGGWSNIMVAPFLYAGIGLPLSGAKIITQVGNVTVPGSIKNNNGEPTAITGEGVVITLWTRKTPTTAWWQPVSAGAAFDIEQWSGFPGSQYRFGLEAHWQGGLRGL